MPCENAVVARNPAKTMRKPLPGHVNFEHDRRSEMFADCIAGSYLARTAEGLDMVARAVLTAVIDMGTETPHGTHPTPLDRLTATYHGVAGVHFDTFDIVDWCEEAFD